MADRQGLINRLIKHGKGEDTWDQIASDYGYENGDQARNVWRRYRMSAQTEVPTNSRFEEDLENGTAEAVFNVDSEIKSLSDLITKCKIDTDKWKITKYVQNYWGNSDSPKYQVKTWLSQKEENDIFKEEFMQYLKTFKPRNVVKRAKANSKGEQACLVINKQDSHYNKHDSNGQNSMEKRFAVIQEKVASLITECSSTKKLEKTIYILGSDQFNSEWTGGTVKGTPQKNVESYQDSFDAVCHHETEVIDFLLENSDQLDVVYVPGNHDEYVGWHLVQWLKSYYRNNKRITVDMSPEYTKYLTFHNTVMMFNHGDDIKPEKLAAKFPIGAKDVWSQCDYRYIFTGDKHHTLAKDLGGIEFYQIPALSNAKSLWDKKRGFDDAKAYLTAFLISGKDGLTNIYKKPI